MSDETFPLDWDRWRAMWAAWKAQHRSELKPSDYRWPPKNIMADEVLGRWLVNGRHVELSEVTFPDFGTGRHDDIRYVGITFGGIDGCESPDEPLVRTFEGGYLAEIVDDLVAEVLS